VRTEDKQTKLADLMLAEALAGSRLQGSFAERKLVSELPYLAPEQTQTGAFVDHLADLYAVGAVTYHLLTGQPPFSGPNAEEVVKRIRESKPARPSSLQPDIPPPFEAIVLKLISRLQEDRYPSALALLGDLETITREAEVPI